MKFALAQNEFIEELVMPVANTEDLEKLIRFIEENLRASSNAGLKFIDLRNFKGRLQSRQNHVVFGRRGAGKSTLINSLNGGLV